MKYGSAAAVLALAMIVFSSSPAFARQASPTVAGLEEAAESEAIALLNQGKAVEAYDLAMRLFKRDPENDSVTYVLARAARASGRVNQAIMAYELLLEKYPGEMGLHLELRQVYQEMGDTLGAGKVEGDIKVLGGDALLARAVQDPLKTIAHGRLCFGFIYDSNVNLGPGSNIMDLGDWRRVRVDNAKRISSTAAYFGADVDLSKRISAQGNTWLVADLHTYVRGNFNNGLRTSQSRESQWLRGAVGLRRLTSGSLLDVRFRGEVFDYEFFQHVSALGPEFTFAKALGASWRLTTRGEIARRDYSQSSQHNGLYYHLGQYAAYVFPGGNEISAGVRYNGSAARLKAYRYDGWEGVLRGLVKLPYRTELSPFAVYGEDRYRGPATALESENRLDKKWRLGVSLNHQLSESWSVELLYQYTTNDSNSGLYQYDQNMVSFGLAYSF